MPVGDAYASVTEYRARIRRSDNAEDVQIQPDLEAVSRYIDKVTGYTRTGFNKDASDTTRYFTVPPRGGSDGNILDIDPLSAAPTSIRVDTDMDAAFASDETILSTTEPTGDIAMLPRNWAYGPEPRPINALKLNPWQTVLASNVWPVGHLVQIVGTFGWAAVPAGIKSATIELTAVLRLESPRATEQVSELEQVMRTSQVAQNILTGLTRTYRSHKVLL